MYLWAAIWSPIYYLNASLSGNKQTGKKMKSSIDIWEDIGSLSEDELLHVMTKLFALYEAEFEKDSTNKESLNFFKNLDNAITQTSQCNSNRR